MTREELEKYAATGQLPDWFPRGQNDQTNNNRQGSDND
jgi:hypothetical protein